MESSDTERWFVVQAPTPEIESIVVGRYLGGFKIDIHGVHANAQFEGGDSLQDSVGAVIRTLKSYVPADAQWMDCDTREPVHVWDALAQLSDLEER